MAEQGRDARLHIQNSAEPSTTSSPQSHQCTLTPASTTTAQHDPYTVSHAEGEFEPTIQELSSLLETFRTNLCPKFPFINPPAIVSVEKLQRERPFFLLSIQV